MYMLVVIFMAGSIGDGGVSSTNLGFANYATLEQCEYAGRQAQNNLVSALNGDDVNIAFTCVPSYDVVREFVPKE